MKSLFMVRHATSMTNTAQYWGDGPASIPLTSEGERDAQAFAANWEQRPDLICCSNYARSIQTAAPLANKFGLSLLTLDVREFTYWDLKLTQEDYQRDRKAEADAYWSRLDPTEKKGGVNAETFIEFVARCRAFRHWAEQTPFETCVVVSHGHFLHAFRAIMKGVDLPHREFMAYLADTLPGNAYANLQVERYFIESGQ